MTIVYLLILMTSSCVDNHGKWLSGNDTCQFRLYSGMCNQPVGYYAPPDLIVKEICPVACTNCPPDLTCDDVLNCTDISCTDEIDTGYNYTAPANILCQNSCKNCPVRSSPRENCQDDPFELIKELYNKPCEEMVNSSGCLSLHNTSAGNEPLWVYCPSSCKTCDRKRDFVFCSDDPNGQLQKAGSNCTALGTYGCNYDVSYFNQSVEKVLVKELCPHMCGTCPNRTGDAHKCREFAVNDYYQYASGSSNPDLRRLLKGYIRGGYHGDPSSCYELGLDSKAGSQTCHLFAAQISLCVPKECSSKDVKDLYRELTVGTYLGTIDATCELDDEDERFTSSGFKISAAVVIILIGMVFVNTSVSYTQRFTTAFDLRTSMCQLLSSRGGETAFLDCVRTISVSWIALGHTYLFFSTSPSFGNPTYELNHITSLRSAPIPASEYAVDSFFWMSGFLGTLILSNVVVKNPKVFSSPKTIAPAVAISYFQRYLRIIPAMGFVMLVGAKLIPDLGFGPNWYLYKLQLFISEPNYCDKYWWRNVLMISNLFDWPNKTCFGWLWYLPCDFQFSLLLPFVVIPYVKLRDSSSILRGCVSFSIFTFLIINLILAYTEKLTRLDDTYVRPYLRIAPWLFGVASAIFLDCCSVQGRLKHFLLFWKPKNQQDPSVEMNEVLYKNGDTKLPRGDTSAGKNKKKRWLSRKQVQIYGSFLISAGLMLSAVFLLFKRESAHEKGDDWSDRSHKAMNIYYLLAWGLGLSICCIQFCLGNGGTVLGGMSHPVWSSLGKLSYGVYLVHPIIIYGQGALLNHPINYTDFWIFYSWLSILAMSFLASLVIWILVERPFAAIVTAVFLKAKRQKAKPVDVENSLTPKIVPLPSRISVDQVLVE